ncbi:Alpha/Beta hydrolase protein [Xylariales sp. PMI_506]|nr:Alpha/Beta hydrolase protein [Xylariales sp. PMI_506]
MANQENAHRRGDFSTSRLNQRYRFNDPNMDLFFLGALGWGPAGGLSVGEAFYVATRITDGDADSWVLAFEHEGEALNAQAEAWRERGRTLAAGEARLKAFASYRSAWQFVGPGERFAGIFRTSQRLFDQAMTELQISSQRFTVPYSGGELPGHFYPSNSPSAPTIMIVGGADTCHEDRFLSQGRYYVDRGYSVALVDLPGQGLVPEHGLYWEIEAEKSIEPRRLALLGMSLGGYFVYRTTAHEPRLAAVIATPALPRPAVLFTAAQKQDADPNAPKPSAVELKNREVLMWKAGVSDVPEIIKKWSGVAVDPKKVQVPFLSVLGRQEGLVFKQETEKWHSAILSPKKSLIILDTETGADAHCQGSNPLRLTQEVDTWLRELLGES